MRTCCFENWWEMDGMPWLERMLQKFYSVPTTKGLYRKWYIQHWLGSYTRKPKHRRVLVKVGKVNAHQCSRIAGSKVGNPNLPKRKTPSSAHLTQDRQFNHGCMHKQNEGNTLGSTQQHHKKSLLVVSGTAVPTSSRARSWSRKYLCRLALKKHFRLKRLVTQQKDISTNKFYVGPINIDLFTSKINCSVPKLFQLVSRPTCSGHRCFFSRLEPTLSLLSWNPTWIWMGQMSCPGDSAESNCSSHYTLSLWPSQSWYSQLLLMAIDHPRLFPPFEFFRIS